MTCPTIRPARPEECAALTDLCLRAKAVWGYDAGFMAACVPALTVHPEALDPLTVVAEGTGLLGLARLCVEGLEADLDKLFVAPEAQGQGVGTALMAWAMAQAAEAGCTRLTVTSDPGARPFYERCGMRVTGETPSEAVPGRLLPTLGCEVPAHA